VFKKWRGFWVFLMVTLLGTFGLIVILLKMNTTETVASSTVSPKKVTPVHEMSSTQVQKKAIQQPAATNQSVTLLAVGDILIHDRVYEVAKKGKAYNFDPMLQAVKPYIQGADLAVANSESMIGGEAIGLTSYPSFNSPYEVGDAVKKAGFDVVTMANNHALDRGPKAALNAVHYWDHLKVVHTGVFLSKKDQNQIRVVSKKGIRFAFLAYTFGTNGIPTPKGKPYLVNRINLPQIQSDVARAKKQSDVVVVSLHFGIEYQHEPNASQIQLVKQLANMGVDVILGSHPHVLQPYQWVSGKNGHRTFVVYSLGNFLSGQAGLDRQIGGMLELTFNKATKKEKSHISLTHTTFIPTYCIPKTYQVIPLSQAGQKGLPHAKAVYKKTLDHMNEKMSHSHV
jgi:poly-gamma-glutamate capsule biosynthesis protein CapA/YwtB (metallophosphatase superfamily)